MIQTIKVVKCKADKSKNYKSIIIRRFKDTARKAYHSLKRRSKSLVMGNEKGDEAVFVEDPASLGFGVVIMEVREDDSSVLSRKQQRLFLKQSRNKLTTWATNKKTNSSKSSSCNEEEILKHVSISYGYTGNHLKTRHRRNKNDSSNMDDDDVERNTVLPKNTTFLDKNEIMTQSSDVSIYT